MVAVMGTRAFIHPYPPEGCLFTRKGASQAQTNSCHNSPTVPLYEGGASSSSNKFMMAAYLSSALLQFMVVNEKLHPDQTMSQGTIRLD